MDLKTRLIYPITRQNVTPKKEDKTMAKRMALTQVGQDNGRRHGFIAQGRERKARIKTDFQKDLQTFSQDPQVRALVQARFATYKLGEPVDSLTLMVKSRLDVLKGGIHAIIK